ncbi:CUE domain containing protein [Nitzschia inconspicua]|uniref:CUE domain containing protein n=1 Tax=Nitzschia inconspicua TaxID=303405 RepID=A0A9K3KAG2_9STRA|nr:CUE domain containing protein [Nitzschia inconspicua]
MKQSPVSSTLMNILPSLYQFYTIGILLFHNNNNHFVTSYQELIESIPETFLCNTFDQLQTATNKLLSTVMTKPNNHNKHNRSNDTMENDDLLPTCQSLCGLFTHSSRLCQVVYMYNINNNDWISTLASLYDRLIVLSSSSVSTSSSSSSTTTTTTTTSLTCAKNCVLATLSSLLLDGLFYKNNNNNDDNNNNNDKCDDKTVKSIEESLLEAIHAMEEGSTSCLGDLQIWQSHHEPFRRTIVSSFLQHQQQQQQQQESTDETENERQDYILNMLESAIQQQQQQQGSSLNHTATDHAVKKKTTTTTTTATTTPGRELDRRIQQVKQILPHLGEGFIEAALSLYQADVQTTVSVLLSSSSEYPSALRVLDPSLPRRRRDHDDLEEGNNDEMERSKEARRIVKERVAIEEQQEMAKYKALVYVTQQQQQDQQQQDQQQHPSSSSFFDDFNDNIDYDRSKDDEYNDDYDDQYDEVDIRLGGVDDGFTMDKAWDDDGDYTITSTTAMKKVDEYQQVKLYNQLVRQDEAEDIFWQENRNLNRHDDKNNNNNDHEDNDNNIGGKQYRGPDKIKGGRIIGPDGKVIKRPGRGGGRGGRGSIPHNKPNNNQNNNSNNNASTKTGSTRKKPPPSAAASRGPGNTKATTTTTTTAAATKPRTKPKSDNRVNRQRDRKQRNQGAFGVAE